MQVHILTYKYFFFTSTWPCCIVTNFFILKPTRCTNFTNLFWHETLHVSDSSSVHHQKFIHCTPGNGISHTRLCPPPLVGGDINVFLKMTLYIRLPNSYGFTFTFSSNLFWQMIVITFNRQLQRSLCRATRQLAYYLLLYVWRDSPPPWTRASSFTRFLYQTRHTKVGRTPLDEWSIRRRDLYLTTHNTHNRWTSMPPVWFEPAMSAGERSQTYALVSLYLYYTN
jgi:hypothetical protein